MRFMHRIILLLAILLFSSPALSQQNKGEHTTHLLALGDSLFTSHDLYDKVTLPEVVQANIVGRNYRLRFTDRSFDSLNLELANSIINRLIEEYKNEKDSTKSNKPDVILLSVGLADIKEDRPLTYIYKELAKLVKTIRTNKIKVVLVGFSVPTDAPKRYQTAQYQKKLAEIYKKVATQYGARLYPNLFTDLEDTSYYRTLDKYHLNARGIRYAAKRLYPLVVK